MGKRHHSVGIKQVVRLEWYDYAVEMLLDGLPASEIRSELDNYISERLQTGGYGDRGEQTYTKAVTQIMKCWVSPVRELVEFRDRALAYAKSHKNDTRIALHWAVTSAAYPFWFRVAEQVGRLLNLQGSITQSQIRSRCYEAMGERSTIERSSRRVIRSFVAWNVLKDSGAKGCYEESDLVVYLDQDLAILMLESALYAKTDGKTALKSVVNSPAFFPFQMPVVTGDFVSRNSVRMEVIRYGLDDEFVMLRDGRARK